jgi:formylglycine-generating enzyme required for sulfatase activity
MGTPYYMSPEQARGLKVDTRTDIFSLGIVIYEMLTGRKPFEGETNSHVVVAILENDPLPLSEISPDIPSGLDEIVMRALRKDLSARYQTAADIIADLKSVKQRLENDGKSASSSRSPEPIRRVRPGPRHKESGRTGGKIWLTIGSLVLVAVVITILAAWVLRSRQGSALPAAGATSRGGLKRLSQDLGGGVKIEMIEIPAGSFMMGSPDDERGRYRDEGPQHEVSMSSFYMGEYEVTQAQWHAVATKLSKVKIDLDPEPSNFKGDSLPVDSVSWEESTEFCDRLSRATSKAYRLPTEAEWEYACRAGTTGPYAGNLDDVAWYRSNSDTTTHPVGTKEPNAFGLCDMHGNVFEWCRDWASDNYYAQSATTDPTGPSSGSNRVSRGGSYLTLPRQSRSALRLTNKAPSYRDTDQGFRLARASD